MKYNQCFYKVLLFMIFSLLSCKQEPTVEQKPTAQVKTELSPQKKIMIEDTLPVVSEEEIGKIIKYQGIVLFKNAHEKEFIKITENFLLKHGQILKTLKKSSAVIEFNNGDTIELYPNTIITLDYRKFRNEARSRIMLKIGRIWTKVKKRIDNAQNSEFPEYSQLQVHTLSAIAGVRGTAFHVMQGIDGSVRIDVDEGMVEVKTKETLVHVKKEETSIIPLLEKPSEVVKTQETKSVEQWNKECEKNLKENAEQIAEKLIDVIQDRDQNFENIGKKVSMVENTLKEMDEKKDNSQIETLDKKIDKKDETDTQKVQEKKLEEKREQEMTIKLTEAVVISDHISELEHQLTAGIELLHEIKTQKFLKKKQKTEILKKIESMKEVEQKEEQRQEIKTKAETQLPRLVNSLVKTNPIVFEKVEEVRKSEQKTNEIKTIIKTIINEKNMLDEKKAEEPQPPIQENPKTDTVPIEKKSTKKEKTSQIKKAQTQKLSDQNEANLKPAQKEETLAPNANKEIAQEKNIAPEPIPETMKKTDNAQEYIDEGPAQIKGAEKTLEKLPDLIKQWENIVSLEKDYQKTIKKIDDIIQKSAYHLDNAEKKRQLIHYNQQLEIMYEQGKILLQKFQNATYEKPEDNQKKIQNVAKYYQMLQKMKQKISTVAYQIRGY